MLPRYHRAEVPTGLVDVAVVRMGNGLVSLLDVLVTTL